MQVPMEQQGMSERVWALLTGFTLHSCGILELEMNKICALCYGLRKLSHLKIYQVESMSVYDMDYDQIELRSFLLSLYSMELRSGSDPGKIPRTTPNTTEVYIPWS